MPVCILSDKGNTPNHNGVVQDKNSLLSPVSALRREAGKGVGFRKQFGSLTDGVRAVSIEKQHVATSVAADGVSGALRHPDAKQNMKLCILSLRLTIIFH